MDWFCCGRAATVCERACVLKRLWFLWSCMCRASLRVFWNGCGASDLRFWHQWWYCVSGFCSCDCAGSVLVKLFPNCVLCRFWCCGPVQWFLAT